jgi:predicted ribosome quality control (RQC) complex YloA/Tae2 family protein
MRLQNIYDINAKTYLFKLARPDFKELVLIESGIRVHSTQYEREKPLQPSSFAMKLRKHLRQRRVSIVRQLGRDRVLIFEFNGNPLPTLNYRLVCEFYAAGNIILTDGENTILSCLRMVKVDEENEYRVGAKLNFMEVDDLAESKSSVLTTQELCQLAISYPKDPIKRLLSSRTAYPTQLVEHALLLSKWPAGERLSQKNAENAVRVLEIAESVFLDLMQCNEQIKGFLIRDNENRFLDLQPVPLAQYPVDTIEEFKTFNEAADAYFSSLDEQRTLQRTEAAQLAAEKKLQSVAQEQEARIEQLEKSQHLARLKADRIMHYQSLVDAAITVVNSGIASGMDWLELEHVITDEKQRRNPVASAISGLDFPTNHIIMRLYQESQLFENEDDIESVTINPEETNPLYLDIRIDLGLTAMANARHYYTTKKQSATKQEKTVAATTKAIKSAKIRIKQDLDTAKKLTPQLAKLRKSFWFEKFHWFISSENLLIVAGRDMHQNELLVKKYLRSTDIYVHADMHGAPSVIIKSPGNKPEEEYPSTLAQAGYMALCLSKAWDSKVVINGWWVWGDQVSKSAPSGEYLTTGSFMIRGRKNMLPPAQLVYGVGILFRLDDDSIARHAGERSRRAVNGTSDSIPLSDQNESYNEELGEELCAGDDDFSETGEPMLGDTHGAAEENPIELSQRVNHEPTSQEEPTDLLATLQNMLLEEDDEESAPETKVEESPFQTASSNINPSGKKSRVSIALRKKMKKSGSMLDDQVEVNINPSEVPENETPAEDLNSRPSSPEELSSNIFNNESETTKMKPLPQVRGKRGKLKKLKSKYAFQDDEDRALAMEVLKPDLGPQPKGKKEKKKLAKKQEQAEIQRLRDEERQQLEQQVAELRKQKENKPNDEPMESEAEDEDCNEVPPDVMSELGDVLNRLTGNPNSEDTLLNAMLVCAPYASLQNYKYKVKLTPGTMKKGKAAKLTLQLFSKVAQGNDSVESILIRAIPDAEWQQIMRAQVKVYAPQLADVRKMGKKGKKH